MEQLLPTQSTPIANAWANNSQPYIVVQMPDAAQMGGGLQTTMPTLEVTLQATGASGTIGRFKMTEAFNVTNAKPPIVSAQTAHVQLVSHDRVQHQRRPAGDGGDDRGQHHHQLRLMN